VSNFGERIARIEERTSSMDEKLDRLVYALEGNGQPGLRLDVDRLKKAEADRAEKDRKRSNVAWAGLAAGVTALVSLVGKWVAAHLHIGGGS
jgi:hypothetical protein